MSTPSNCSEFQEAISARMDGETPAIAGAEIDDHLAACQDCREFSSRVSQLQQTVGKSTPPKNPDEDQQKERIVAAIGKGRAPSAPLVIAGRIIPTRVVVLGTAAVIVAILGIFVGVNSATSSSRTSSNGVVSVRQVAGSSQQSGHYPGATVTPKSFPKPDVTFTDTSGQPFNIASQTQGKVTLVYFGYTHCPDVCPINVALAAQALEQMPKAEQSRVQLIFITTDPNRDTPPVLRAWLDHFNSRFIGLTGSIQQIQQAEQQVGMPISASVQPPPGSPPGNYEIDHAGYTMLFGQDNRAHIQFDTTESPPGYAKTLEYMIKHGFES